MATYVFTDLDSTYIQMTINGSIDRLIKKQYIKMEVSEPYLTIYHHDQERTRSRYSPKVAYTDVTSPSEASAADLKTAIEAMIAVSAPPASGNTTVMNEVPTGAINGVNTVYTTAAGFSADSVQVFFKDGGTGAFVMLDNGVDFTETGASQITLGFAPATSSIIKINYIQS